jgi:hypothetical protein
LGIATNERAFVSTPVTREDECLALPPDAEIAYLSESKSAIR